MDKCGRSYEKQDIAIATFLILLWKDTYRAKDNASERAQPPGGFVDMGSVPERDNTSEK